MIFQLKSGQMKKKKKDKLALNDYERNKATRTSSCDFFNIISKSTILCSAPKQIRKM